MGGEDPLAEAGPRGKRGMEAADLLASSRRRRPEYPWQLELPPWAPKAKQTEAERRAGFARSMFDFAVGWREDGMGDHPLLFWDERRGFFRFSGGRFALSRERANWRALKDAGFFSAETSPRCLRPMARPTLSGRSSSIWPPNGRKLCGS